MATHYEFAARNEHAYRGNIVTPDTADPHVALLSDSATGNIDHQTHETWSELSTYEIDPSTNDGYTAGGQALTNAVFARTGDMCYFDADDVVWSTSTITARHCILYDAQTDYLYTHGDFEALEESDNGDFAIEWTGTDGIFTVTANY